MISSWNSHQQPSSILKSKHSKNTIQRYPNVIHAEKWWKILQVLVFHNQTIALKRAENILFTGKMLQVTEFDRFEFGRCVPGSTDWHVQCKVFVLCAQHQSSCGKKHRDTLSEIHLAHSLSVWPLANFLAIVHLETPYCFQASHDPSVCDKRLQSCTLGDSLSVVSDLAWWHPSSVRTRKPQASPRPTESKLRDQPGSLFCPALWLLLKHVTLCYSSRP